MKTLAVLTSGGDSPGMNSAVRAVVKLAAGRGVRVLGVERGYDGLIEGCFRDLTRSVGTGLASAEGVQRMGNSGGTVLRVGPLERFRTREGRREAARHLKDIDGLLVVGGNGSLAGAHQLALEHRGVCVVGIPASIDNDVGCTSMSIGVDTALNTICEACDRISDTARAHRRAFVVEVMGRESGYLAMASAVATGADAVLFREQGRSDEEIIESAANAIGKGFSSGGGQRRVLIIKSEGVHLPCTRLVRELEPRVDALVPGVEVRATVLGHIVRGGRPSYFDRAIAGRLAFAAVGTVLDGESDQMVAWQSSASGGAATSDPMVKRFPLAAVLEETKALLDGSSPVVQRRVQMLEQVEGILGL